jgi:hypothetical protein
MNEEIKDPNQLDLFAGILFTPEQEQKIAEFIKNRENTANVIESINKQHEQLLINNGFVKNVDFVNTFKVETVTREMQLGYQYNKTDFKAEVTFKDTTGYISLKGKRFNLYSAPNELIDTTFSIDFEGDKVNCSMIQDNYRYIKPSTLFDKLMEFNKRQEQLFEEYKKKNSLKQNIVDKYTKLYPNATVTVKNDYSKYSGTFDIVEVKFESDSYVQFRLDTYNNKEYLHKRYDAEFEVLNSDELLDRFSKQVKKEGSN